MSAMPIDPHEFSDSVIEILRNAYPERAAHLTGPLHLLLDGRHLGLENLYRMVLRDPKSGAEIVQAYLERLMEGDQLSGAPLPLAVARARIMPRIQPESIFEHLDPAQVAHVPFVNSTVIVFVIDLPQLTVSITTEQMIRWGMQCDDLEVIARDNLAKYTPELEIKILDNADGGRAAIVSQQDGYDAARLLLGRLHDRLKRELHGDFWVATPSRDTFLAISQGPEPFLDRLRERVGEDFRRLPYPITKDLFFVCRDGVAGTAA